jgi:hypothetical protein
MTLAKGHDATTADSHRVAATRTVHAVTIDLRRFHLVTGYRRREFLCSFM